MLKGAKKVVLLPTQAYVFRLVITLLNRYIIVVLHFFLSGLLFVNKLKTHLTKDKQKPFDCDKSNIPLFSHFFDKIKNTHNFREEKNE